MRWALQRVARALISFVYAQRRKKVKVIVEGQV
jgi:hypothetical protein